ncbi:MAG: hypothetical protein ACM3SY_03275 [Candidatus Omnitrophota bacterium]
MEYSNRELASISAEWALVLRNSAELEESPEKKPKILQQALDRIEDAINKNNSKPDYYEIKGLLFTDLSLLQHGDDSLSTLEKANSAFQLSAMHQNSYKTHFQWARNLYSMSRIAQQKEKQTRYLDEADKRFSIAVELRNNHPDLFYYWGVCLIFLSRMSSYNAAKRPLTIKAIDKLNTCVNLKKDSLDAHFHLGASQFIIWKESDKEEQPLYFRDAFYHFEWTVSLFHNIPGFYFKAEEIEIFRGNPFQFVRTLENYYQMEPLWELWIGPTDVNPVFLKTIEAAVKREKEALLEKTQDGEEVQS